jgi:hypothetical protein
MRLGSCFPTIDAFAFEPQLCIITLLSIHFRPKSNYFFPMQFLAPRCHLIYFSILKNTTVERYITRA